MLSSLTSGASGLDSFQQEMNVIGNNIANVNTTGYKAATVDFASAFSNTLNAAAGSTAATSRGNSVQVGTGVSIGGINSNWTQGALSTTNIPSNLAITGPGFFLVKDTSSLTTYATRAGDFSVDDQGYLITDTGDRVQGYTDGSLSTIGDVKIDSTGAADPTAGIAGYVINSQGTVTVNMQDGTQFVRGQVVMQNYTDPDKLLNVGGNLFMNLDAAGPTGTPGAPGTNGLGTVESNKIELSNVDLSNEMVNLITAQRAFEANSKIITTSDEALQTVVNMKH